jgi:hypothetical protein
MISLIDYTAPPLADSSDIVTMLKKFNVNVPLAIRARLRATPLAMSTARMHMRFRAFIGTSHEQFLAMVEQLNTAIVIIQETTSVDNYALEPLRSRRDLIVSIQEDLLALDTLMTEFGLVDPMDKTAVVIEEPKFPGTIGEIMRQAIK